jgi:hypothetical protein
MTVPNQTRRRIYYFPADWGQSALPLDIRIAICLTLSIALSGESFPKTLIRQGF